MAEVSNKIIKITVDTDKAKIKIEGIEGYFRKAETAAKALNNSLEQNSKKWGQTETALRKTIDAYKSLRSQTAGTPQEYKRQTIEIERLEEELTKLTGTQVKASKSMGSMESSAGIAGATVSELGRTISDMPYGITAVTNNISQLGSMFAILVQKTGSLTKAVKSLFATLKASPALVVLLAFQAVVAVIDVLAQNSRKAEKAFKGLNDAIGQSATELKIARKILNDTNASLAQKGSILTDVNSKYKDLNLSLGENGLATQSSTDAIDKQISSLERLAKTQGIVAEVSRIYGEMAVLQAKSGSESADFLDKSYATFLNLGNEIQLITTLGVFGDRGFDYYENKIEELGEKTRQASLKESQKTADALISQLDGLFPEKESGERSAKKLEDLNLLIVKTEIEHLESIIEITEEGQLKKQKRINELKLLEFDLVKQNALERAKEEGRNSAELLAINDVYEKKRQILIKESNDTIKDIIASFNQEIKTEIMGMSDFTSEEQKDLNILNKIFGTDVKTVEDQLKEHSGKVISGLAAYQKKRQEVEDDGNKAVSKLREEDKLAAIYAFQDVSNAVFGVMDESFQREMDLEQDKTNKVNNELKERLANEQLSADERKKIQDQIGQNDEALRKKQDEIERKKFKMNKVASIANATINTYLAATAALKDPALSTFQRIASMVSIIGSGLAQVAVIAKQKFVSSQSSIGAGAAASGAGSSGVQAPDFNVVGQSSSNQIASVIQSQMQKPIRTYVVSKDVSSAQEMDRNIVTTASLG